MPTSEDILIADVITTDLAGETFSQTVDVERLWVADWDLKKELVGTIRVGVWPAEASGQNWERDSVLRTYTIGIGITTKVAKATAADIDALADLVDEIRKHLELAGVAIPSGKGFDFMGWEYLVRFSDERLDRHKDDAGVVTYTGLFASALTLVYQSTDDEE